MDLTILDALETNELNEVITYAKTLLKKKNNPIKEYFKQLNKNSNFNRNELYNDYLNWVKENNQSIIDKQLFNRYANIYIDEYSIIMKTRIKEKIEKEKNNNSDVVSKNEK